MKNKRNSNFLKRLFGPQITLRLSMEIFLCFTVHLKPSTSLKGKVLHTQKNPKPTVPFPSVTRPLHWREYF